MWHDDNWQPYAEHEAPSVASNSWRRFRQNGVPMPAAPMGPPMMIPGMHGRTLSYHHGRQVPPYARPLPQPHPLMRNGHGIAAASRELNWRTANDGWGVFFFLFFGS